MVEVAESTMFLLRSNIWLAPASSSALKSLWQVAPTESCPIRIKTPSDWGPLLLRKDASEWFRCSCRGLPHVMGRTKYAHAVSCLLVPSEAKYLHSGLRCNIGLRSLRLACLLRRISWSTMQCGSTYFVARERNRKGQVSQKPN